MSHSTTMRRAAAVAASAITALALSVPFAQAAPRESTLRSEAPRDLEIGSAVWGQRDLLDYDRKHPTEFQRILAAEFSSLTPENDMKWAEVHPEPGVYDFSGADAVVAFARANHQEVRGHTLLWHSQNPQWVTDASADWTCEEALASTTHCGFWLCQSSVCPRTSWPLACAKATTASAPEKS